MPEVLTAPRVLTAADGVVTDGAVVIEDTKVRWAGPAAALPPGYAAGSRRTDYPGCTILPGLIDAHVHLGFDGGPRPVERVRGETDEQQLVLMLRSARELLGVGVTTARDLGSRGYLGVIVRDAIAQNLARGPRLLVAASPVTVTDAGIDNTPHHQYLGGLEYLASLGFSPAEVIAMATGRAAAALGLGDVTGALAPGLEADVLVVAGDPLADITALGRLRRVLARGRDYVPDSGKFDVSAPGTPFARPGAGIDLTLLTEATRLRRPAGRLAASEDGTRRR